MMIARAPKVILLGSMSKMPVAGIVFITVQYLVGLKRLGYDVYYVEADGRTPSMLMRDRDDDGAARASTFIERTLSRFDFGAGQWAYHALHADGHCYGMSRERLDALYSSAALIINLHGGTDPLVEHSSGGRLVYLGTDPVLREIELDRGEPETTRFIEAHSAFFTWGENHGNPDCGVPVSERFDFVPTRQPIVPDMWDPFRNGAGEHFTTIGNWRQPWRDVTFRGETYHWSKHHEFLKFIDLPMRTDQTFELALGSYTAEDRELLEAKRWKVVDSLSFSMDIDQYRRYIGHSRAEFTVAKDQNVRLRSGWFSDRSASYLAMGRPVITQETGFSSILPTGAGLFAFSTLDDLLAAVEAVNADYPGHCEAASALAREWFDYRVVLPPMMLHAGASIVEYARRPTPPIAEQQAVAVTDGDVGATETAAAVQTNSAPEPSPSRVEIALSPPSFFTLMTDRARASRRLSLWITLSLLLSVWYLRTQSRWALGLLIFYGALAVLSAFDNLRN